MIPIGDTIPTRRTPVVTRALIVVNLAAFVYELLLGARVDAFVREWGVTPLVVSRALAEDPRAYGEDLITLITSQFLHGGLLHLGSNMLFLWIFGDNVEDRLGRPLYLVFYLACGVLAALAQVFADPASRLPLVGASGAIAGVLGAYLLLYPGAWVIVVVPLFLFLFPLPVPAVLVLGLWFVSQLLSGVAAIAETQATGGIAFWAHVGGFLAGMGLIAILPKSAKPPGPARPGRPTGPSAPTARWPTEVMPRPRARPSPVVRLVGAISDLVVVLILARIVVVLLDPRGTGVIGGLGQFLLRWTWPLVAPLADLLPVARFGDLIVELYAVAALIVYQLLFALVAALLGGSGARSGR
jgi:membrane associated rhomboid family serine protease